MLNRPSSASNGSAPGSAPGLTIGSGDLGSFERLLGEIQTAYGREDIDKRAAITTPEIQKQGLRSEISDVNLLQGDLSEAWRENSSDCAMVAMRFSLVDVMFNRATGHVVSGDRTRPTQATELWTFRRDDRTRADGWQLSAIQQAA
jgi:predicted lipid-binding transport protein (Tim44 family)